MIVSSLKFTLTLISISILILNCNANKTIDSPNKSNEINESNEICLSSDIYDILYDMSYVIVSKLKLIDDELNEIKSDQLLVSQFSNPEKDLNKNIRIINENNKKINNLIDNYNKLTITYNSIENSISDIYRKLYKPIHLIYIWNLISMSILIIIILIVIYIGFK